MSNYIFINVQDQGRSVGEGGRDMLPSPPGEGGRDMLPPPLGGRLLISLVFGVEWLNGMSFEGKMRKLINKFCIKLVKRGHGEIPSGRAILLNPPPPGKAHATPLFRTIIPTSV